MPNEARSHAVCRTLVCLCCGNRSRNNIYLEATSPFLELVKTHINSTYDISIISNPIGICNSCKVYLYKLKKGEEISSKVQHSWILTQERIRLSPRFRGITIIKLLDNRGISGNDWDLILIIKSSFLAAYSNV